MTRFLIDLLTVPPSRYPDKWKPAFLAMQLGFIAGGIGLLGRDLLLILTIENWQPIIFSELFFASFVGVGFILHTVGFAKFGVTDQEADQGRQDYLAVVPHVAYVNDVNWVHLMMIP